MIQINDKFAFDEEYYSKVFLSDFVKQVVTFYLNFITYEARKRIYEVALQYIVIYCYDKYTPTIYPRRMGNGGLLDPNNIVPHITITDEGYLSLYIEYLAKPNPFGMNNFDYVNKGTELSPNDNLAYCISGFDEDDETFIQPSFVYMNDYQKHIDKTNPQTWANPYERPFIQMTYRYFLTDYFIEDMATKLKSHKEGLNKICNRLVKKHFSKIFISI